MSYSDNYIDYGWADGCHTKADRETKKRHQSDWVTRQLKIVADAAEKWPDWRKKEAGMLTEHKEKELEELKIATRDNVRQTMRELSEDFFACGWVGGLEYSLWRALVEPDRRRGHFGGMGKTERRLLWHLAKVSGGWWRWDKLVNREVFVPMDVWEADYNTWEGLE